MHHAYTIFFSLELVRHWTSVSLLGRLQDIVFQIFQPPPPTPPPPPPPPQPLHMYSYNVIHSMGKWISLDIFCYITYSFTNKSLSVKTELRPVNNSSWRFSLFKALIEIPILMLSPLHELSVAWQVIRFSITDCMHVIKTLFTWSGGPRSSVVGFICFVSPRAWKQKKPTPLDRGPPLNVNRP